jgi:hypothetical protein
MTKLTIFRAYVPNGYVEYLDEADAKGVSDNVEMIEREIVEDTPIPVIDPIKARLDALEAKVGLIERETLIERRERI